MDVQVTPLPGIGSREDFITRSGYRVGVITHRDGHMELIVSSEEDPDGCAASTPLTPEEGNTLASLLGAPHLVSRLVAQQRHPEDIVITQFPIPPHSPYDGRTLAETALRTRTGVSVLAVLRRSAVHLAPPADFAFQANDTVVMVGTEDGVEDAAHLLERG